MPESRDELARAVTEVLAWMESTPEAAGAALGINVRTLTAMAQGLTPMRSLVIRFAEGVRRRCEHAEGVPDWWRDIDAWLKAAGYPPRRENPAPGPRPSIEGNGQRPPHRPAFQPPRPVADPGDAPPASEYYRPIYERQPWGDTFLHVFWVVNPQDERIFQRTMRADYDYKAEATKLKQDLAKLSRQQFERKYGRFRK